MVLVLDKKTQNTFLITLVCESCHSCLAVHPSEDTLCLSGRSNATALISTLVLRPRWSSIGTGKNCLTQLYFPLVFRQINSLQEGMKPHCEFHSLIVLVSFRRMLCSHHMTIFLETNQRTPISFRSMSLLNGFLPYMASFFQMDTIT